MKKSVRVSYGSAVELGLTDGKLATRPRTAYLLLGEGACRGKCIFCPQSRDGAPERIARVSWPQFPLESVLEALCSSRSIERVCLQCPDEEAAMEELSSLVGRVAGGHPVSVAMPPWGAELMANLKVAGAERLTVPIDCASPRLFRAVKGRAMPECLNALKSAVELFGVGMVGTHVIVGLGETEKEVVALAGRLLSMGVMPSLFALTPVKGTMMEGRGPPPVATFRRLQLALYIMEEVGAESEGFSFNSRGRIAGYPVEKTALEATVKSGKPFETRGCPGCNRPYFNERVSGPLFNFPRPPSQGEIKCIEEELFGSA
jgi:biotin synthase-related radical SAM superfamily protein